MALANNFAHVAANLPLSLCECNVFVSQIEFMTCGATLTPRYTCRAAILGDPPGAGAGAKVLHLTAIPLLPLQFECFNMPSYLMELLCKLDNWKDYKWLGQ
ncbi:uncharacterized protein Dsimw501_GD28700 [Drosophila simulans]|uniref:Uncharacterized protein n=1 Tax=Drosophila simulans TaxID=7240 RepID=A0A0J9R3J1_DROSI|nr:uncharacterized protein Dsimw501_GD28700 [Drosophila simulans]